MNQLNSSKTSPKEEGSRKEFRAYSEPYIPKRKKCIKNVENAHSFVSSIIDQYHTSLEIEMDKMYGYKIHKLVRIVEVCVPEGNITKDDINASSAISAITELNKMQGHYSPEKTINANVNVDADLEKLRDLVEKNKKEF